MQSLEQALNSPISVENSHKDSKDGDIGGNKFILSSKQMVIKRVNKRNMAS